MNYRVVIHPDAVVDIEDASNWYEDKQSGLGEDFSKAVRETIRKLRVNPLIYSVRSSRYQVRWCYPNRFPYRIVYRVVGELITIAAVIHASCHWRKRL